MGHLMMDFVYEKYDLDFNPTSDFSLHCVNSFLNERKY